MPITTTFDKDMNLDFTVQGHTRARTLLARGDLAFPTYAGGGVSLNVFQFATWDFVTIAPNQSGYLFEPDYTNKKIKVVDPVSRLEIASDTALASWSAVRFLAFAH